MANDLFSYYTSKGQALPSVASRATAYSGYGLGGGYTGTSQQNAALLARMQGSGPSSAVPNAAPANGGYSATPSGQPQPVLNDPGINSLTDFTTTNNAARTALVDRLNAGSTGAFDKFAGETGLTDKATALARIQSDLAGTGVAIADTPLNVNQQVQGTFANDTQRQGEIASNLVPLNALYSKVATALPGAATAYETANDMTKTKLGVFMDTQARELTGFDKNAEQELSAIQAKVSRGQQLTDQEFQRETQLSVGKLQYDAAVKAAQISAGASTANAQTASQTALKSAAMQYPGISVTPGANGTFTGSLPSYLQPGGTAAPAAPAVTPQGVQSVLDKYAPDGTVLGNVNDVPSFTGALNANPLRHYVASPF